MSFNNPSKNVDPSLQNIFDSEQPDQQDIQDIVETSDSPETTEALEDSLLVVQIVSKQYVVMRPEELKALGSEHKVICYADKESSSLKKLSGERIKALPKDGIEGFLEGMITALNMLEQGAEDEAETVNPEQTPQEKAIQISESRDSLSSEKVQSAIGKALRITAKTMDRNIDRWVMEASDKLNKTASLKTMGEKQRFMAAAQHLQSSSESLSKRFQARLVECLHKFNHPEKEQIEFSKQTGANLSLAEDGEWHRQTAIFSLSSSVTGQTKLDFNQLNRRFSYLLNRRVKPEKNVIGPEMLAWCFCTALADLSYSREQIDVLQKVAAEFFGGSLGKIYREINLLWIGMDILPQIKLRVWQEDYKPTSDY